MGGSEVDVVVVSAGAKGLNALGMLSHEASIIANKERAEMKMLEFFIPRKLSLTAPGIQSQSAVRVKRAGIADRDRGWSSVARQSSTRLARFASFTVNEVAFVLVRLAHVASRIVNTNHG